MQKTALKAGRKLIPAFTLVELIVVVTILAILATVGFLSLSGYSDDARTATVKSNVRTVYSAILTESTTSGNSPRHYVDHSTGAALSGAVAYLEGSQVVLAGGQSGDPGTNYSAGNPRWDRLRMNGEKFRLADGSGAGLAYAFGGIGALADGASAAYSTGELAVGAVDVFKTLPNGRKRNVPFFQVAGIPSGSKTASVTGNYPSDPSGAQGLVRSSESATGALKDGLAWPAFPTYPGCDTPDIILSNGQRWAACNVGASKVYNGQPYPSSSAPNDSQKAYLGAFFQWGRNDDVTTTAKTGALAASGTLAWEVGHSYFITSTTDWIAIPNDNLWGGGSTSLGFGTFADRSMENRSAMRGPCALWYHVPTQAEWWSAISNLNGALTNTTWQSDTKLAAALKLPLAGYRESSAAWYGLQGTDGHYWSSTPAGINGYHVHLRTGEVNPACTPNRGLGFSVRCLAD